MAESDPERKGQAGKDLIRAIFGKDAIAECPIFLVVRAVSGSTSSRE
jgi:hypothetical protein